MKRSRSMALVMATMAPAVQAAPQPPGRIEVAEASIPQLQAALEIARRTLHEKLAAGAAMSAPGAVRDYLRLLLHARRLLRPRAALHCAMGCCAIGEA